jgi:hypothetical protein
LGKPALEILGESFDRSGPVQEPRQFVGTSQRILDFAKKAAFHDLGGKPSPQPRRGLLQPSGDDPRVVGRIDRELDCAMPAGFTVPSGVGSNALRIIGGSRTSGSRAAAKLKASFKRSKLSTRTA